MKREIKFRAWTGAEMEYSVIVGKYGAFYVNPGVKGDGLDEKDKACLTTFNTLYPINTSIMQFTGLKDKNGKEIYEGDIVKDKPEEMKEIIYQIKWNEFCARFDLWWKDGSSCIKSDLVDSPTCYEVIGNIYENPEIITQ